jgi:2-polyprenyl-3-methyl-5-hydroxy-6-metoxy-1,4-benzoquinol methylase
VKFELPDIRYDFRDFANPEDELRSLWLSWVEYYRIKAAIAKWISPRSILEIGVRYGYSARAFLEGAPTASYVGIDANNSRSGGAQAGGFEWSKKILPNTVTLIEADTAGMSRLPGGVYDLIHVDGEQNGLGTYHDLELAAKQGRWILCDGYFWTAENFHAANDFLLRYRDVIDFSLALPGYAGEMLIRVSDSYVETCAENAQEEIFSSSHLKSYYNSGYFLGDCGGYDTFRRYKGSVVSDARLTSLTDLLFARQPGKVLDLGCGRGEIAIQAALAGCEVTAVDYSEDAIEIGREAHASAKNAKGSIEWNCCSVASVVLDGMYNTVVCSDVIEHMTPPEVEAMYGLVARHLKSDGWFIVHTFPNRWYYDYHYRRRRRLAGSVGAHLPFEPRSRYEKLMHINEQRPQDMRRQLNKFFPHVCFWFGSPDEPQGSLTAPFRSKDLAAFRDLFAVASHSAIDPEIIRSSLAPSRPLSLVEARSIELRCLDCPEEMAQFSRKTVGVEVRNGAAEKISSRAPFPLHLSYHWLSTQDGSIDTFDGLRTSLGTIYPHQQRRIPMEIRAPSKAGDYILQLRLVQEGVRWHEGEIFSGLPQDYAVSITSC